MERAYTDAAGRAAGRTELGAGDIGGMTSPPGVYKWGTGLLIPTDVTLSGNADDVWIFQVAGNLTMSSGAAVLLSGGARRGTSSGRSPVPWFSARRRTARGRPDSDGPSPWRRARRSTAGSWRRPRSPSTAAPWSSPSKRSQARRAARRSARAGVAASSARAGAAGRPTAPSPPYAWPSGGSAGARAGVCRAFEPEREGSMKRSTRDQAKGKLENLKGKVKEMPGS